MSLPLLPLQMTTREATASLAEALDELRIHLGDFGTFVIEHACADWDEGEDIGHVHIETSDGSCFALLVIKQHHDE